MDESTSNKNYILARTDGYSITTVGHYTSHTSAKRVMHQQYNDMIKGLDLVADKRWLALSHKDDDSAILYDRGDNVFVWQIIKA